MNLNTAMATRKHLAFYSVIKCILLIIQYMKKDHRISDFPTKTVLLNQSNIILLCSDTFDLVNTFSLSWTIW